MNANGYHNSRGIAATDSTSCPRFIAYAAEDSYVDGDDDLESLVAVILADNSGEDIVIWEDTTRIAAVITANKVTRFKKRAKL